MPSCADTYRPDPARRLVLLAAGTIAGLVAFLGVPAAADAQVLVCPPPGHAQCRPLCEDDAADLTATIAGLGSGVLQASAKNPYKGAADNANKGTDECATSTGTGPPTWTWEVKRWCGLHCEHWHTLVSPGTLGGGTPYPATAIVTATPDAGSFFTGWTGPCAPPSNVAESRIACAVFMDADKAVQANLAVAADGTAPSAPTIAKGGVARYAITVTWKADPATDETWLGGYEILRNNGVGTSTVLRYRAAPTATSYTAKSLLCNTTYTWQVRAFDSVNQTDSNTISIKTGACAKVPPNTVLHVMPPRSTRNRTAYFHWGAMRRGVEVTRFSSKCKLGKRLWKRCYPGKTYRNLSPGYHTVRIKVGDSQGWDPTPAKWTWFVRR